ncbi:MAG TPA: tetratricopeptide repeat protein [Pyrinomonadaceae bacterium]|nr:tetratricopeptide repeat protein [Pyrinomonadaceae bacterium]
MLKVIFKSVLLALLIFAGPSSWAQQQSTTPKEFDRVAAQAEQARNANRIQEAIELYRKALSLRPSWAEGWFNLGTLLYDRDAYAEATQAFTRATALSPKIGTAWVMLGLCEFKLERYDEALKHIQRGRRLGTSAEPQFRQVMLYHEGLLLIGKGEFRGAQETLGLMSREGVESEELIVALGLSVLNIRFSDLLAGDSTLRELVRRAGRAEHLSAQKKFDEAMGEYERMATDFPKAPNVQHAYGRFLLASNQDEKAIEAFKREIENAPTHLLARLLIADTKLRLRDYAGGLPYAEEAVKLRPQLPLAHYLLGSLLLDTGQTARAIAELETARTGLPNEAKIHYALGRAYARAGRKAEAEQARAAFARLNKQGGEK